MTSNPLIAGGLSLRDYFAASALTGIMIADTIGEVAQRGVRGFQDDCETAYMWADEMLNARWGDAPPVPITKKTKRPKTFGEALKREARKARRRAVKGRR